MHGLIGRAAGKAVDARGGSVAEGRGVAARFVARLVAGSFGVAEGELYGPLRGSPSVAKARQIAMYLMHTALSRSFIEVGIAFGRDRSTVAHACGAVEDMRDDLAIDIKIATIEQIIETVAPLLAAEASR